MAVVAWLPVWLVLWLVLVPSLDRWEVAAGVLVAAAASAALVVAGGDRWVGRGTGWSLVRSFPLLVAHIVRDSARLAVALARTLRTGRAPPSRLRRLPLPSRGAGTGAQARRAAAVVSTSLTPNRVAIRVDGEDLVVHELVPAGRRS